MTKIGFLGPIGTYSHQAALQQFPTDITKNSHNNDDNNNQKEDETYEFIPLNTIPDCFDDLLHDSNKIDFAVIPLENSTNGQVVFSYDLLRDLMLNTKTDKTKSNLTNELVTDLTIVGEQYVSITHCLLSTHSNVTLDDLSNYEKINVYSHPQVWGQVKNYLNKLRSKCPETIWQTIDCNSTSNAVIKCRTLDEEIAKNDESKGKILNLAIASKIAGKLYNMNYVDESINDKLGNTTRFLVLKRHDNNTETLREPAANTTNMITLLTFLTEQDYPGSLVDVLNVLKDNDLNMTSISSRPFNAESVEFIKRDNGKVVRKWQYIFYVEFNNNSCTDMTHFYKMINDKCLRWCQWGTFPRNDEYYK